MQKSLHTHACKCTLILLRKIFKLKSLIQHEIRSLAFYDFTSTSLPAYGKLKVIFIGLAETLVTTQSFVPRFSDTGLKAVIE